MCTALLFTNDAADTEIYTLSLHDALPILAVFGMLGQSLAVVARLRVTVRVLPLVIGRELVGRTVTVMIVQEAAFAPLRAQVPAGRVSETVTLAESPVPPAVKRSVKLAVSP